MEMRGKKVYVGLSGGVDSAVSGALLKRAGADVTGVFIKGWYPPGMPCTWVFERRDAMRVAAHLRIPFLTFDAQTTYKESVVDYLLSEYRAGRTPNPDILCNRDVKFGAFYRFAIARGADTIATGHYRSGDKDQSYFLWAVQKEVLDTAIFPVGDKTKEEVRARAKDLNIPVAQKRDSQGVCFIGDISVEEFLRKEFGEAPGIARDSAGNEVGRHDSVLFYTIGERIALRDAPKGPWFVLAKDIEKNEITVGKSSKPDQASTTTRIEFTDANWHFDPSKVTCAQYRYRGPYVEGRIEGSCFVSDEPILDTPVPGQSLVFYSGTTLAGGGVII